MTYVTSTLSGHCFIADKRWKTIKKALYVVFFLINKSTNWTPTKCKNKWSYRLHNTDIKTVSTAWRHNSNFIFAAVITYREI